MRKQAALFVVVLLFAPFVDADPPKIPNRPLVIVSEQKVWNEGEHNAFTDLIRWQDNWYCTFRESKAHVGGDGKIRLLKSTNGHQWESIALLGETGIDLRDPKLSITADDRLMLVMGDRCMKEKH